MHQQFQKKASPIFRDRIGINEFFNNYLVQLCEFELGDVIL
jgi:hypothetical protein